MASCRLAPCSTGSPARCLSPQCRQRHASMRFIHCECSIYTAVSILAPDICEKLRSIMQQLNCLCPLPHQASTAVASAARWARLAARSARRAALCLRFSAAGSHSSSSDAALVCRLLAGWRLLRVRFGAGFSAGGACTFWQRGEGMGSRGGKAQRSSREGHRVTLCLQSHFCACVCPCTLGPPLYRQPTSAAGPASMSCPSSCCSASCPRWPGK